MLAASTHVKMNDLAEAVSSYQAVRFRDGFEGAEKLDSEPGFEGTDSEPGFEPDQLNPTP